jgi:hypothetical protein
MRKRLKIKNGTRATWIEEKGTADPGSGNEARDQGNPRVPEMKAG